jgi:hypothetical protein
MKKVTKRLIFDSILLILSTFIITFLWEKTILTAILLFIVSICILIKTGKSNMIFFVIIGIAATLIESLSIMTGAWIYSTQNIIGMPFWILLYWGIGGIAIKDLYLFYREITKNKSFLKHNP